MLANNLDLIYHISFSVKTYALFVNEIRDMTDSENFVMALLDIKDLYTNVLLKNTIYICFYR